MYLKHRLRTLFNLNVKTSDNDGGERREHEFGYSRYLTINVSNSEGEAMYKRGTELSQNAPYYSGTVYNCSTFSEDILSKGSWKLDLAIQYSKSPLPNNFYNDMNTFYKETKIGQ